MYEKSAGVREVADCLLKDSRSPNVEHAPSVFAFVMGVQRREMEPGLPNRP